MHIGTAGWSIPREVAASFPGDGQHLARLARVLGCAEINTSFYRPHRREVYARWASQTPEGFRFAVKVPRSVTHDARLRGVREPLQQFVHEATALGDRLGPWLVQLPPSLAFDADEAGAFFRLFAALHPGPVVCEPRHASWFAPDADACLVAWRVSRAAADPARLPEAAVPGGWMGPEGDGRGAVLYHRWHGSPRIYWSRYEADWLARQADALAQWPTGSDRWCIFDNTAGGGAAGNALALQRRLRGGPIEEDGAAP